MHGYVVVDIGCLECGESSLLVGIVTGMPNRRWRRSTEMR